MEYRNSAAGNLKISEIGFGCMSLQVDDKLNSSLIQEAIDLGINYFDTADLYDKGANEKILGDALLGKREKVIIGTKVGNQWKNDGSGWLWNPSKKYILKAIDESLIRLKTDYIDFYQLHGGTIDDPFDEIIEAFEKLIHLGKIKHYGISSIRPNVVKNIAVKSAFQSLMVQYSLLDRRPEEEILETASNNKMDIFARGVLAKGLLINKNPSVYLNRNEAEIALLQKELHALQKTPDDASPAIGYVLSDPRITSAIIGIRTITQLHQIINALEQLPLVPSHYQKLNSLFPIDKYDQHRL